MLLYCTMISFGFVCHRQGVSPFSKQGWGCLENIPNIREHIIFQNIYRPYWWTYSLYPLHNDSFGVFWNDIIFYEHFIHRNKIMPKICLILSRSKFWYVGCCVMVWNLCVEYGRRKYQRRRSNNKFIFLVIYCVIYLVCIYIYILVLVYIITEYMICILSILLPPYSPPSSFSLLCGN